MELLIPGLILVALMVYASTRIKKKAAAALDRERITTETFTIVKPEGFINIALPDAGLLFQAYSKEFASGSNGVRSVVATVSDAAAGDVDGETTFERGGEEFVAITRTISSTAGKLALKVETPVASRDACSLEIDEMLGSFAAVPR